MSESWEKRTVDETIAEEEIQARSGITEVTESNNFLPCHDIYWSSNGLCPCCGTELDVTESDALEVEGDDALVGILQSCPHCGWESDPYYDE